MSFKLSNAVSIGTNLLEGLGAVRENRDDQASRKDYKRRSSFAAGLSGGLKSPLIAGYAPGGFLRDALAGERSRKAAESSFDALFSAKSLGSRQSAAARAALGGGKAAEMLERSGADLQAGLEADSRLAGFALSSLGATTASKRSNPFNDVARGLKTWGTEAAALAG